MLGYPHNNPTQPVVIGLRHDKYPPGGRRRCPNSPDKQAALEGLERWKSRYPDAAKLLAVDAILVDSMRGRSSTWTRIRVNLRNVPEDLRPPQNTPDPDE